LRRIGLGGEVSQPDSVGKSVQHPRADLHCQSGLSDAGRTGDCAEPTTPQGVYYVCDVVLPSDKVSNLLRQIVRSVVQNP
jgi:hypothetical protein